MKFEKYNNQIDHTKKANTAKLENKKRGLGGTRGHFPNARTDKIK